MKPSLELKLSQHLALTPQLQQAIRLLQLSTLELEAEIEQFLIENPLLERIEPEDSPFESQDTEPVPEAPPDTEDSTLTDTSFADDDDSFYAEDFGGTERSQDDEDLRESQETEAARPLLREHLITQLGLLKLSDRDHGLVRALIDSLNDDGYLTQSLEDILEWLPPSFEISLEELQIALQHLQHFEPTGIGARSLQECLSLQLDALPPSSEKTLASRIVKEHLALLAARDFVKLKKLTRASEDALRCAQQLIQGLNPRPGAQYAASDIRYVTPDILVRKLRGQWQAQINQEAYPRVRINRLYAEVLSAQRGSPLTGQLQEARWLIRNVQQRFETILRVSQAIIERQRQFFEHGEIAMRPLILKEIADALNLHESTISRVTTQKYMATPQGIFELKYFFGSHVATDAGGACSATAIRALIKQLINKENPKDPFSDSEISNLLKQQGIVVARRTVAKYRESLGIAQTKLRKAI